MAGQGAKKRLEENRKRLSTLRTLLLVGLVCQLICLGLAIRKGTWGFGTIAGLVVTTAVGFACFSTISSIAKPVFDEQGEMIDGGGDLNRGGINGYSHDILYITAFVQVTTLLSSWFWYAYLAIPAYALYQLTIQIIIPHFKSSLSNQPGEPQMDAGTRKKLQKAEDRAQRRRNKWS